MDKNSKPKIQFTKLTSDDISKHSDFYCCLLMRDKDRLLSEKGKELHEAMQLFYEAFK